jgi:epoxyqueuosine reductase
MPDTSSITQQVLARCRELGFALAGVCAAEPTSYERQLIEWLDGGKHGEMEYLARNTAQRVDPATMLPGARSIICVADRYAADTASSQQGGKSTSEVMAAGGNPRIRGRIARYARGDDYHAAMKKRLQRLCDELRAVFPGDLFRACVDTAPVLEREHAQRAGLGAVGKHTLLIQPGAGSYLLLGEILTTLEIAPSRSMRDINPCGSCTRCIEACPTNAITPWSVDARRCISYLTIEHRSMIDEQFHRAMGDWIFGCDICQEVCPHNQPTEAKRGLQVEVSEAYRSRRDGLDLLEVLGWTEESRRAAFVRSSMKRAKLAMLKRNALIAAGNAVEREGAGRELRERISAAAGDLNESPLVRDTARVVAARLGSLVEVNGAEPR